MFELLTVLCYSSENRLLEGHNMVLKALMRFRDIRSETRLHQTWMDFLSTVLDSKEKVGAAGGLIAGVGWVGENRVVEKDVTDYLVS